MTSSEARNGVGRMVAESKLCETGILKELIYIPGGDGRRSEYLVRVEYPYQERTVPLSAVRFAKQKSPPVRVVRKGVDHNEFLRAMNSVFYSGPKELNGTHIQYDERQHSYALAFRVVFGRLPTAAELEFMAGGEPNAGECGRCRKKRRVQFLPDGTPGSACGCTDSLSRAFSMSAP